MLLGTIDRKHFMPHLMMTLAWDDKVSVMQNLLAALSRTMFI